jgi:hypothetical protein
VVHFTEDSHCEQSSRRQPSDESIVKTGVPETVTDNDIGGRPIRESDVEIKNIKRATLADPTTLCQVTGETHRYRRNINSVDREPSVCEPDSRHTTTAGEVDPVSQFREQMLVRGEHCRRTRSAMRRESVAGVLLIPVHTILLGHSSNLEAEPGLLLSGKCEGSPRDYYRRD